MTTKAEPTEKYQPGFGMETENSIQYVADSFDKLQERAVRDGWSDPSILEYLSGGSSVLSSDRMEIIWSIFGPESLSNLGLTTAAEVHGGYLPNGARLYIDAGDHPEYSIPEAANPEEAFWYELTGEQVMYDAIAQLTTLGGLSRAVLYKRSNDFNGHAWGSHENLNFPANDIASRHRFFDLMAVHNLTKAIYTGAGGYAGVGSNKNSYQVSPRLAHINSLFARSRYTEKPLVCTHVIPDVSSDSVRLQQASNEANIFYWPIIMRHGMNSVLARLALAGVGGVDLGVRVQSGMDREFVRAAHVVAGDTGLERTFSLSGAEITALNIQNNLLKVAYEFEKTGRVSFTDFELLTLSELERVLADLESNPRGVLDRVEWIAKRTLIEQSIGRNTSVDATTAGQRLDLEWTRMPDGFGFKLRSNGLGWGESRPAQGEADEQVARYYHRPSGSTRASIRADAIRDDATAFVNTWSKYYNRATQKFVYLPLYPEL